MSNRNTIPLITKYELAAVLAERAEEIAAGEPITIKNPGTTDPVKIAQMEYDAGKLPKKIKRVWPNGNIETWNIGELKKF